MQIDARANNPDALFMVASSQFCPIIAGIVAVKPFTRAGIVVHSQRGRMAGLLHLRTGERRPFLLRSGKSARRSGLRQDAPTATAPTDRMNDLFDKSRPRRPDTRVIAIRGAREHNLKNIDVEIPRDQLVVFTGLSGSGKSSLAFDTIYAEGQRRYVESRSPPMPGSSWR